MVGKTLGHYEILEPLGAGGMGEVYRARDTKLDRDVAIKVLPEDFAADAERLARFTREAKLLASLNHPNIAGVFGLEDEGDTQFIAMELVEGETLAARIAGSGRIEVEEALDIARQIAEALEAAHDNGVIHRDLKPANVVVTAAGKAKVLDFGLAKASVPEGSDTDDPLTHSPTVTVGATEAGVLLGTAPYMSPEQAKGKVLDKRTDIWAFGCVTYEMLTGKRPFQGDNVTETLAAVLKEEPDWDRLPRGTPTTVALLLRRCLRKDPARRLRDIGDAGIELDEAIESPGDGPPALAVAGGTSVPRWRNALLVAAGVAISAAVAWTLWPTVERPGVTRFTYDMPPGRELRGGWPLIAVAPDGRSFAYSSTEGLWVQSLEELEARSIPESRGAWQSLFFSPDGREIGFWEGGQLRRVGLERGAPVPIVTTARPRGTVSWEADGNVVYALADGIWRVPAAGGDAEHLISATDPYDPQLLPGGDAVLFLSGEQAVVQPLSAIDPTVLPLEADAVRYVSSGHLIYRQGEVLYAVPFDLSTLRLAGQAQPVAYGVGWRSGSTAAQYGVSANGTLVYVVGDLDPVAVPVWVDRSDGHEEALAIPPGAYYVARVSPDGTRAALEERRLTSDLAILDFATNNLTRLPIGGEGGWYPVWLDNDRIAYDSQDDDAVHIRASNGTGTVEKVTGVGTAPYGMTDDGHLLSRGPGGIWISDFTGGTTPSLLIGESTSDRSALNAVLSPDGRWIAYQSNQADGWQVYVRSFPLVDEEKVKVSRNGGIEPRWSPRGEELFYIEAPTGLSAGTMMSVRYAAADQRFVHEAAVPLFSWPYASKVIIRTYDITPDGERFLAIKPAEVTPEERPRIVVVMNWFEELERLVPADGSR